MKILFFVSSLNAGGAERVAVTLANAWGRRGDQVCLVPAYSQGSGTSFYDIDSRVELIWLAHRMRRSWLPGPLAKMRAMQDLVREKQPDLILSFLTNVNVTVLLALRQSGVPIVVSERTNPVFSSSAGRVLKALRKRLYPYAQVVTLQTEASVPAFKAMVPGMRSVAVVPNPLPPELLLLERELKVSESRHCTLIAMGRMVYSKRFDVLIRTFSRLAAEHPEWRLCIYGEGPLRTSLQALVRQTGMQDRISLPGKTTQPWQELGRAQAFVMTSEVEGFPNVLLEAMAMGLPCVTVDCPSGPREMSVNGHAARLVPLGDETALRMALDEVMSEGVLRDALGRRAAQTVREQYDLQGILQRWDQVFSLARGMEDLGVGS